MKPVCGTQRASEPEQRYFTYNADSKTFAGKVVRQIKDAGTAFCNLISRLWNSIVRFVNDNTPSDRELRDAWKTVKRDTSDCWLSLKRFFSDLFNPPSSATKINRGFSDFCRDTKRAACDLF